MHAYACLSKKRIEINHHHYQKRKGLYLNYQYQLIGKMEKIKLRVLENGIMFSTHTCFFFFFFFFAFLGIRIFLM